MERRADGASPTQCAVLVLAPHSWHGQWVNRQQLFSRVGVSHPVLYSDGGWFTWERHTPEWKRAAWLGSFARHNNVWVDESPRILMRAPRLRALDEAVLEAQVNRWRRFLRAHGTKPLVAYVYHPTFRAYVGKIRADYLVYHAFDMYDHMPGWTADMERDERTLLGIADLVITSSERTAQSLRAKVAREIRVLPNAANVAAFDRALATAAPVPDDLSAIPSPRLGYVGTVNPKIDFPLIAELARRRPTCNFVFVGQVSTPGAVADAERAKCAALQNVHFLGAKRRDEVPSYAINMDVNLICYRLSDQSWEKWGYPNKLHEYLAAGRPVVSSDMPSIRPFAEVVHIASGVEGWQQAIEQALLDGGRGTPERRRAIAAANSWDDRVQTLERWLGEMTSQRQASASQSLGRPGLPHL